jgi:hypothetical protein
VLLKWWYFQYACTLASVYELLIRIWSAAWLNAVNMITMSAVYFTLSQRQHFSKTDGKPAKPQYDVLTGRWKSECCSTCTIQWETDKVSKWDNFNTRFRVVGTHTWIIDPQFWNWISIYFFLHCRIHKSSWSVRLKWRRGQWHGTNMDGRNPTALLQCFQLNLQSYKWAEDARLPLPQLWTFISVA